MKNVRKFLVFVMLILLFSLGAAVLLGPTLAEQAANLRDTAYLPFERVLFGEDGGVYALEVQREGYRLIKAGEKGRQSARNLECADWVVDDLHVMASGEALLSVYEYRDGRAEALALYAWDTDGQTRPLLRRVLSGQNDLARRHSVRISAFSESQGVASFFVSAQGACQSYDYGGLEGGLALKDAFQLEDMVGGLVWQGEIYAALEGGGLAAIEGGQRLPAQGSYGALYPGEGGLYCARALDGGLYRWDFETQALEPVMDFSLQSWPWQGQSLTFSDVNARGDVLLLGEGGRVYGASGGSAKEITRLLYLPVFLSALMLLGVVAGVLALSTLCWYLLCYSRKLYFPMVLRNLLGLGLVGLALGAGALALFILPSMRESARDTNQRALVNYLEGLSQDSLTAQDLNLAATRLEEKHGYSDVSLHLCQRGEPYAVELSSQPLEGWGLRGPGPYAPLGAFVAQAPPWAAWTATSVQAGRAWYGAGIAASEGRVLVAWVGAGSIERALCRQALTAAFWMYGAMLALALLSALSFLGVARGVRRVIRGVDLINAGRLDVKVEQHSGDEVEALAQAFNDMTGAIAKALSGFESRSSAYRQFMPQQLVALLGAKSVEEVNKSTTACRTMVVMMVHFELPEGEAREAGAMFEAINEVIERTCAVVSRHGGTAYNFTHQGYDAVFDGDGAAAAGAAVELRQELMALNSLREQRGGQSARLRVALDRGDVTMGVVGDGSHMTPTVASACLATARTLIEAARLTDANILLTKQVEQGAKEYSLRYIGKCRQGEELIRVYELFDGDQYPVRLAKGMSRKQFADGLYTFYSRDFTGAKGRFMELARLRGEDGVARRYLYLADKFEKQPPEEICLN